MDRYHRLLRAVSSRNEDGKAGRHVVLPKLQISESALCRDLRSLSPPLRQESLAAPRNSCHRFSAVVFLPAAIPNEVDSRVRFSTPRRNSALRRTPLYGPFLSCR